MSLTVVNRTQLRSSASSAVHFASASEVAIEQDTERGILVLLCCWFGLVWFGWWPCVSETTTSFILLSLSKTKRHGVT